MDPARRQDDWRGRVYLGLTGITWMRVGVIALLLLGLFWPNLRRLWLKANPFTGEANWRHTFFVPLIGLYYLYLNREALTGAPMARLQNPQQKLLGLWAQVQLALWGVVFFAWAYYPRAFEGLGGALIEGPLLGLGAASLFYVLSIRSWQSRRAVWWRNRLAAASEGTAYWFGLYTMIWGIVLYAWAIWPGQNDFFKDCAMVFTLFGVTLMLCDWWRMRILWFPILFLFCAIPWPGLVYSWIAMPLQQLAASAAVGTLRASGVEALRTGTQILIGDGTTVRVLNVAEACAGLKSLMTFISVAAALGFVIYSHRALWQRLLITASAVPIAVFCNTLRVAGQGILDQYFSHDLSVGFAHEFVGMVMLVPAFFLILLVAWILDNLFIEEVDKRGLEMTSPSGAGRQGVIEIPRQAPRPTGSEDLAAATQRLMASRSARRPQEPPKPPQG